MNRLIPFLTLVVSLGLAGCGPVLNTDEARENRVYLLAELPPKPPNLAGELRILIRENSLLPDVLAHFQATYGVRLTVDTYSEKQLLESITTETVSDYDMVMLTDYELRSFETQGELADLNTDNIPNLEFLDPEFLSWDHGLDHQTAIPFAQDVLGVAFNIRELYHFPRSWKQMREKEDLERVRGKIALPATPRLLFGTSMVFRDVDPNSANPADVAVAIEGMKTTLADLEPIFSDHVHDQLVSGEILFALDHSSDLGRVIEENPSVRMVLPDRGALARVFCLAVPAASRARETAEFFINYLHIPEIAAANTNFNYMASTNSEVGPFLDTRVWNGPSYLRPAYGDKFHFLVPLGDDEAIFDDAMTELQNYLGNPTAIVEWQESHPAQKSNR